MAKRECENCGNDFKLQTGQEEYCLPCEMAIRAMEPPQHLKDIRWVYEGNKPVTPSQKLVADMMEKNPHNFLERLTRLEDEYRKQVAKGMPEKKVALHWDGKGTCPTCNRGVHAVDKSVQACLDKAEGWLVNRARETADAEADEG